MGPMHFFDGTAPCRRDRPSAVGYRGPMPATLRKRSLVVSGHRTSVSLETAFWTALKDMAAERGVSVNRLIADIDRTRVGNLSSAIRVFVLDSVRDRR